VALRTDFTISELLRDLDRVAIKCPKCNRHSQYTVGRVRHNPNLKCPSSRTPFVVQIGQSTDDTLTIAK
jgi:hypothetical protein